MANRLSGYAAVVSDNRLVPYSRWDGTDQFDGWVEQSIYYVPLAAPGGNGGANVVQSGSMTSSYSIGTPEFSYDYTKLAYVHDFAEIRIYDLVAATDTFVIGFDEPIFGINARLRWSPDGTYIAFGEAEQFPPRTRFYSVHTTGAPFKTILKETVSLGDIGWLPDSSKVIYCAGGLIRSVSPDGTGDASLGVSVPNSPYNALHVGKQTGVIVWQDIVANTLKKCNPDGSGVTTIHTFGANSRRSSNHSLTDDESGWVYAYDSNNFDNNDGWWTSEIGKDSELFFIPLDGSGQVSTGQWAFTEYQGGNLGNNPLDVPHTFGDRIYCSVNTVNTGGDYPSGDPSHYKFCSFKLDGSDRRVEDEFDGSGPYPQPAGDYSWQRITMEDALGE